MTDTKAPKADPTDNTWSFGQFSRKLQFIHKFVLLRTIKSFATYQPILLGGEEIRSGDRECANRWNLIEGTLAGGKAKSLLDLGCAEGYFVRQAAARLKYISLGVDGDIRRISVAQSLANFDRIANAGFILGNIDPAFIQKLPSFDAVIFCSVLHHVIRERGLVEARQVMEAVRACTRQTLIFDMGQSNEVSYPWASELPRMEPDPVSWISSYLAEFGFRDVRVIGETSGYAGAHPRFLFAASV